MSTETIDQVIDAATIADEAPVEATTEETVDTPNEPEAAKVDEVVFPKKAVNAISRRDKQIGKLRAEIAQRDAELARFRQSEPRQEVKQSGPREEDYDNYADYLEAKLEAKLEQKWSQTQAKQTQEYQKTQQQAQEIAWKQEREDYVAEKASEVVKVYPALSEIVQEYADVLDSFPPHIEQVWLEADNAPLALIALANEGKLEALAHMSPAKAAMEIAKAEIRGEQIAKTKPITKAPAPMASVKGSGSGPKALDDMSWDELKKWQRS